MFINHQNPKAPQNGARAVHPPMERLSFDSIFASSPSLLTFVCIYLWTQFLQVALLGCHFYASPFYADLFLFTFLRSASSPLPWLVGYNKVRGAPSVPLLSSATVQQQCDYYGLRKTEMVSGHICLGIVATCNDRSLYLCW